MKLFNLFSEKKKPEEELLTKLLRKDVVWEKYVADGLIGYKGIFYTKKTVEDNPIRSMIQIAEYYAPYGTTYFIRIGIGTEENKPLSFYSDSYMAKELIEWARQVIKEKEEIESKNKQIELEKQCKSILDIL